MMVIRKWFVVAISLFAVLSTAANGQSPPPLQTGVRVRVRVEGCDPRCRRRRVEGTFVTVSRDTLLLQPELGAAPLAIPITSVTRLEVKEGQKSRGVGRWALIGFGGGLLLGTVVGATANADCHSDDCGIVYLVTWPAGAAVGLIGGVLIGSAKVDRWEEAPLGRLRLQVAPQPGGGFGFGASIKF